MMWKTLKSCSRTKTISKKCGWWLTKTVIPPLKYLTTFRFIERIRLHRFHLASKCTNGTFCEQHACKVKTTFRSSFCTAQKAVRLEYSVPEQPAFLSNRIENSFRLLRSGTVHRRGKDHRGEPTAKRIRLRGVPEPWQNARGTSTVQTQDGYWWETHRFRTQSASRKGTTSQEESRSLSRKSQF